MFALDMPKAPVCARHSRPCKATWTSKPHFAPQDLICAALHDMLPSTAEEIAEVTGLDPATTADCLDRLAARCRVMFNPLTKRFSLPKAGPHAALAA